MKRRDFIRGLGGTTTLTTAPATAQTNLVTGPVRRVSVLIYGAEKDPVTQMRATALRDGLRKLDWVEGQNLKLDIRFAAADPNRVRSYAKEIVDSAPDVIVAGAAPVAQAVKQRTRTIPIVFVEPTSPAAFGLPGNTAQPEGNATGIVNLYLAIGARWVELLKQAAPRIRRVVALFNPDFDSKGYLAPIDAAAPTFDVKVVKAPVRNGDEIKRAVDAANDPNTGLIVVPPAPHFSDLELIFKLATLHRMPVIYPTLGYANAGGLMAYGVDSVEMYRGAASFVDRILRGAKPADLTIQFPTTFELAVNLKAAKAIGLQIPESLLARAATVIE
jgi:putative tryptophan/tyrosine transport system substrate-binding protein